MGIFISININNEINKYELHLSHLLIPLSLPIEPVEQIGAGTDLIISDKDHFMHSLQTSPSSSHILGIYVTSEWGPSHVSASTEWGPSRIYVSSEWGHSHISVTAEW